MYDRCRVSIAFSRLDRKGGSAAAGGSRVRINDLEGCTDQIFHEIDLRAAQEFKRSIINDHGNAITLEALIIGIHGVVERETILKAGATTTGHRDPHHQLGLILLFDQPCDSLCRRRGKGHFRLFDDIEDVAHSSSSRLIFGHYSADLCNSKIYSSLI